MFNRRAPFGFGIVDDEARRRRRPSRARRGPKAAVAALEPRLLLSAAPIISEFLASNGGGLADEDGDLSDWIELYNAGDEAVDLAGWSLTDDPEDLREWVFPTTVLEPGGFLVVFASDKDRAVAGAELHANFKLGASGDFLALVRPDQTIASAFAPTYPPQSNDVSYGATFDTARLVAPGATAAVKVPTDGALEGAWNSESYAPDGSWTVGPTGVGYGLLQPGFSVRFVRANAPVATLAAADAVLASPASQTAATATAADVVNYLGLGAPGHFLNDGPFPTQTSLFVVNDFVVDATAAVTIPHAGAWTFNVNSDDGFRLTLERDGQVVTSQFDGQRGASDTLQTFQLQAGRYQLRLTGYNSVGGAALELSAAAGAFATFDPGAFRLVGDTAGGGLAAGRPATDDSGSTTVATDVGAAMRGVDAAAYVRIPFDVADPAAFDALTLLMRYSDGFVAYVNGVEVAAANAPAAPTFDSTATAVRAGDPNVAQSFNLTPYRSLLHPGTNLLAIRGLNASADDDEFLVLPELLGSTAHPDRFGYFAAPTPGGPNSLAYAGTIAPVRAGVERGFFTSPFTVSLSTATAGAEIRYTLDGSEPTATRGQVYTGPLTIASTTVLRFGAFAPGWLSPAAGTETYVFPADVARQSADGAPPPGWPAGPVNGQVFDYGMDPRIVDDPTYGPMLQAALKAVPTISITTDLANLLDPAAGIYVNGYQSGRDWERPASVELINPDGSPGFQIDAGLRLRGSNSGSGENPKHSFRLFFRGEYGASSLDFPLFGSEGVDSFDKLDLRTAQNYSWSFEGDPDNNFIAEVFARDSMRDLGQPYTRSRFYQLYLNGQYWGLYQSEERPGADFAASYLGGDADDYDVIKTESGPYVIEATDGNLDAWRRLWDAVAGPDQLDLSQNANYYKLQGENPDGSPNPNYENLVDVDNLIDYMLVTLYGGNLDGPISALLGNQAPNNFFAIRDRTGAGGGFKFIQRDAESTLLDVNENRNGPYPAGQDFARFNPQYLHQQLMANAEYRQRFADLALKAFGPGGALSPEAAQARFQAEADQIQLAIVAESARWGDAQRPDDPLTRADWQAAVDRVLNDYMPHRTAIVWDQLRAAGLYPNVAAPSFLVDGVPSAGGPVPRGSTATIAAAAGTIYYTVDGSDPRLPGGAVGPGAIAFAGGTVNLPRTTTLTARVLQNGVWSAAARARFQTGVPAAAGNLAVTEINYNPAPGPEADDEQLFEFVELRNVGNQEIDLAGVRFTEGIAFDFTGSAIASLAPGEYVVIVKDPKAFAARFGTGVPVAGAYDGSLSNGGETITVVDATGATIESFTYGDKQPWPKSADGGGATLVRVDPLADPDAADDWRASDVPGGTPGNADSIPPTMSGLGDRAISQGSTLDLAFTVGDAETPAAALVVLASSDNPALLPAGALVPGGSGTSRTLRIAPNPGASGSAAITITVVDGDGAVARRTFRLDVTPVDLPPVMAPIADVTIHAGETAAAIASAVDPEGRPVAYYLTADSPTGANLIPNTGAFYWTAAADLAPGRYVFTVAAFDGAQYATTPLVVVVTPPEPAPTPEPTPAPVLATSATFSTTIRGTTVALAFSGPLTPWEAGDANRYIVILAGPDGRFDTRDDRLLWPIPASYDPASGVVTLASPLRIPPAMRFRVAIPDGALRDAWGRALDGDRDGRPGGGLVIELGGRPAPRPVPVPRPTPIPRPTPQPVPRPALGMMRQAASSFRR